MAATVGWGSPRVGLFGGTFDPPHLGHLAVALAADAAFALDRLVWLPAGHPPHKPAGATASSKDRLAMVALLVDSVGQAHWSVEDWDLTAEDAPPSFTADLLARSREAWPAPAELVFLLGDDALEAFPRWREPERIARIARLAVVDRPGYADAARRAIAAVPALAGRLHRVHLHADADRSSTTVREGLRAGKPVTALLPGAVASYIECHRLYRSALPAPPRPLGPSAPPRPLGPSAPPRGGTLPH